MIKYHLLISLGMLLSTPLYSALKYRSSTEILSDKSEAYELENINFTKNSSYDEEGAELVSDESDSFSINDWHLRYSRGYYDEFELTLTSTLRSVKSETINDSASNSGLESVGIVGKYIFLNEQKLRNGLSVHLKKSLFTNNRYTLFSDVPSDEVALGDDGQEFGLDYLVTYFDKYWRYDFKFGYNKPASDLSAEIVYNVEAIYDFKKLFLYTGLGGIHSLKNDPYSDTPTSKPIVATGTSRLFNSINREKKFIYAGLEYAIGNFLVGLRGETIFSGRSTDSGQTIALSVRYEKQSTQLKSEKLVQVQKFTEKYTAEGFVEKVSKSGNMIKINIGLSKGIEKGSSVDVFNINNYAKGIPMAKGIVVEISQDWAIVRLQKRLSNAAIQTGYLVRVQ